MFCPRCGRTVNDTANFCGGCGLPMAEIIKYHQAQMATPVVPPVQPVTNPAQEIEETATQLENRLKDDSAVPVTDYTTEVADDTNTISEVTTPSDFIRQEIAQEKKAVQNSEYTYGQSRYSYNAPAYPETTAKVEDLSAYRTEEYEDYTLSTVDYIWMMLISSLPVIGLIYLLYTGFASENPNKRSYAKAVLIVGIFGCLVAAVFAMGIILSQIAFFY